MRDASSLDPETRAALNGFRDLLARCYGKRLRGVVLFGSRARGDHRPDSDADVAVFIDDSDDPIRDQMDMAGEAYHIFLDQGLLIQPWVFKGRPERPDTRRAAARGWRPLQSSATTSRPGMRANSSLSVVRIAWP